MISKPRIVFILLFIIVLPKSILAQNTATIYGKITDSKGKPIQSVSVAIEESSIGTITDKSGGYVISNIPVNKQREVNITFSFVGYERKSRKITISPGERVVVNMSLSLDEHRIGDVVISGRRIKADLIKIDPKVAEILPTISGDIEAIIKTLPGVASSNELSSQYSVRGGNFDENLVYVNDIEIYRPFLVRSGQQEGLSFINSDLISSIEFSAGGFDAKYGDKMSSVLDIKYKKPTGYHASASASLLGASAHAEGVLPSGFTFLTGIRYKTTQYVLNTLETEGEYRPQFVDIQSYFTYDIGDKLELSFLGNYAKNQYRFVPETRSTEFGTIQYAYNLKMYFDGQEIDDFTTRLGAITLKYSPTKKFTNKLIFSAFNTSEKESFDIQSQYLLNELDKRIGSDTFGDSIMNLGIGTELEHARNVLDANVYNIAYKGRYANSNHEVEWGLKYQHDEIDDKLEEWTMLDSAGYSLPYSRVRVNLKETLLSNIQFESNRFSAYFQDSYIFESKQGEWNFTSGLRLNYWDFNEQTIVSPRASLSFLPDWSRKVKITTDSINSEIKRYERKKVDILFRIAAGLYYQPPFYKELRNFDGTLNEEIKAQRSVHFVFGSDYNFTIWGRPFKLITELYYKELSRLIPYQVDNVRIRYYADDVAKGYAYGIDCKLNGHFVKEVDSWVSVSLMQTHEDIRHDQHGYIPRPTDQLLNVGLFFQDYLPTNELYKMHLTLLYGSRLPHGPPDRERYEATLRMPAYTRVDIGFSRDIKPQNSKNAFFKKFNRIWISAEVFNLLGINNTISYNWITVVPNSVNPNPTAPEQFAVPNRLTARRFNLRLIAKF